MPEGAVPAFAMASPLKKRRLQIKLKIAEPNADQSEELLWSELDSF
jgi:hypothetical protein